MRATLALLIAGIALSGAPGIAAAGAPGTGTPNGPGVAAPADGENAPPPWPGNDADGNNTTVVQPGQQLAGAVGAQGASVQSELWNRTLADRLDDASTPGERAEVLADEAATLETYLDALAGVRANVTGAWENGTVSEGEYRASLSAFVVRAYAVERRANRTERAVERLPVGLRERHDVNATYVGNLSERAHDLYQFEDEIGQEVANETLSNRNASALIDAPVDAPNRSTSSP